MTYDHWKTTDPADEFLGPDPDLEDGDSLMSEIQPSIKIMAPCREVDSSERAIATERRRIAKLIEGWDPLSDRWRGMPMGPAQIKELILFHIHSGVHC